MSSTIASEPIESGPAAGRSPHVQHDGGLLAHRRSRRKLAVALIVGELALLSAGVVVFRRTAIEDQLEESVRNAISIDHPGLKVAAEGRDITISGAVSDASAKRVVASIARRRPGVRTVDVSGVGPAAQLDPENTGTVPDGTPVPTTGQPPIRPPQVSAVFRPSGVTISGEVPTDEAKAALVGRLLARSDDLTLVDELVVSPAPKERPDLAQYRRLGTFFDTMARLRASRATVNFDRTILSLDAEVASEADRDLLRREGVVLVGGAADQVRGEITVAASTATTTVTDSTVAGASTTIVGASGPVPSTPEALAAQSAINGAINDRTISFALDAFSLTVDGEAVVADVAAALKSSTAKVEVGGHTDWKGRAPRNLALSQKRADAVRDALIEAGIDASRISAKGYGEELPVASNETDSGRARNRRIEIRVVG